MSHLRYLNKFLDGAVVKHMPMGQIISRRREKGKSNHDIRTVYSVSNTQGLVNAEDFRDNTIHSKDTSNYTIVQPGMFAYNPSRLNIGSIAFLKTDTAGLVSPMYVVFSVDKNIVTYDYLSLFIKSSYCKNKINSLTEEGARFRFDFERWNLIDVPIPPIKVQTEIVRILDAFTELTAELTAELVARKQQYGYYHDQFLTFNDNEVEWKTLEDISVIFDSLHQTPQYTENGLSMIRVTNIKGGLLDLNDALKVSNETFKMFTKRYAPQKFDLVMSRVGSYGNVSIVPLDNAVCMGQNTVVIHPLINKKFLYYVLSSEGVKSFIEKNVAGGSQKTLSLKSIKAIPIPIPSEDQQTRIVTILDKFDALTTSLTEGLPREIELRQQQYEYYRELLLSFPKTEVADHD